MAYFIQGREKTVGQLLNADFSYRIPSYQRPYAWPKECALQLLDDVAASLARGRQSGSAGSNYYLGNIILSRSDTSSIANIVDGQQRLVTITILLALLRDRGGALAVAAAQAIADTNGVRRVMPREQDAAFLLEFAQLPGSTTRIPADLIADETTMSGDAAEQAEEVEIGDDAGVGAEDEDDIVEEEEEEEEDEEDEELSEEDAAAQQAALAPVNDSRRAILDNRDAMRRRLDELLAGGDLSAEALTFFLLERCHVIQVLVPNNSDAHRVFVVMHERGLELSPTDILKSELLGAIGDAAELAACQQIWEAAEAQLGRQAFEQLFGHLRMIKLQSAPRKAVFVELRDAYLPEHGPAQFVRDVVAPAAASLEQVLRGTWRCVQGDQQHVQEVNRRLLRLALLPSATWIPVAMRLIELFGDDADALVQLIRRLDALSYGLYLIEPRAERIRRYAVVLGAIDAGRTAQQLCAVELNLNPIETNQLADMITQGSLRSSAQKRAVLLRRLDSEQLTGIGPLPNYEDTNVEHVLPESPARGSMWLQWFASTKGFVQNIGNLIIIPSDDNRRLGNEEFEVKKNGSSRKRGYRQIHAELGFGLIPDILAMPEWGPAIVKAREERFENLLLGLWQLQRPTAKGKAAARRRRKEQAAAAKVLATMAAPSSDLPAAATKRKRRRRRSATPTVD